MQRRQKTIDEMPESKGVMKFLGLPNRETMKELKQSFLKHLDKLQWPTPVDGFKLAKGDSCLHRQNGENG